MDRPTHEQINPPTSPRNVPVTALLWLCCLLATLTVRGSGSSSRPSHEGSDSQAGAPMGGRRNRRAGEGSGMRAELLVAVSFRAQQSLS